MKDPFELTPGDTFGARARREMEAEGRPARAFLEAAAMDALARMVDPLTAARLGAGLADALDAGLSLPTAISERATLERDRAVAQVEVVNATDSAVVRVRLHEDHLVPETAIELATALLVHAAAAGATRALALGMCGVTTVGDTGPRRDAPTRTAAGDAT